MNKILLLLTIFFISIRCSSPEKPIFKSLNNIDIKKASLTEVTIHADAIFDNPNNLSGKLSIEDLHILVDNVDIGIISSKEFNVPKKESFTIPLTGTFPLSKIYKNNKKGILNSILSIATTDSLTIEYDGKIRYHLHDFSYPYHINTSQKIKIK
ncbi:hypothetical protein HN014_22085 [Aquimarina sp. TRL1]|uniref:hypothetical protein n=1 Tax=Aquimarina sp. (strain TRL1) TaxID=2736252 RepID=UPI00158AA2C6|nr:hypothetical protein [Aquimarina sp. TRL1]QKX07492.1 hypothetical protein HN014_22085 [Aquimarina sp. TRL1]